MVYSIQQGWYVQQRMIAHMKREGPITTGNIIKFLSLLLVFNIALGTIIYLEATDDEKIVPVRGISMTHNEPKLGIIDPADGVIITPYSSNDSIVSAVQGPREGVKSCGYWGDVIGFKADGGESKSICHRVLFYLVFNLSRAKENDLNSILIDVPEMEAYGRRCIFVRSWGYSDYLFASSLLRPFLEDFKLTNNSLEELRKGSGYITMGDHNDGVDQENIRPVKYEWVLGKVEVVDNPFGAHNAVSVFILSIFVIMFLGTNLWAYREMFEKGRPVDKKIYVVFFIFFISVYFSGYFNQIYTSQNMGVDHIRSTILQTMAGGAIILIWLWMKPHGGPLIELSRKKDTTLAGFLSSSRQSILFQSAAGAVIAYAFMKWNLYILSQTMIFLLFMAIFYRLSVPLYFKDITPVKEFPAKETSCGSSEGKNEKKSSFSGIFGRKKERRSAVRSESALLDWMVLSMLMLLVGLMYFIEGLGYLYLLIFGTVFANLMIINYSIKTHYMPSSTEVPADQHNDPGLPGS